MIVKDLKPLIKGKADLIGILSGGIALYNITDIENNIWQIGIDLTDREDVGRDAMFLPTYTKAITLMRWIRRSNEKDQLIKIHTSKC